MSSGNGRLRVLLLEDRKEDRLLAIRELRRAFANVAIREVIDAAEFEAALREGAFDVVVTDFQLRWSTGLAIVQIVKARYPATPVVMFTATGSQEAAVEAMKAGLDDYVVKSPPHLVRLSAAIRTSLERARARQDAEEERQRFLQRERELREAAESANRAKDDFLAVLSHELRTPLTSILGWARMLRSRRLASDAADHAMDVIERNAVALGQLVEDLLDVSRIIAGRVRLDVHVVELSEVMRAAVDAVQPAARAKDIAIEFTPCPDVVQISGDAARLQQVAWNLLTNSVKFTPRYGRVRAGVRAQNGVGVMLVSDSGPGIAREHVATMFEPFQQGDLSPTRAHGGLGLGLTIVRHLVDLHGGSIDVRSPGELGGATLLVRLPRVTSRGAVEAVRSGARSQAARLPTALPSLKGVRVLLVDDEPDGREMMAIVLRECGAEVLAVASALEAREIVMRDAPHVLVSDIAMADEDGYELIRQIRALPRDRGGAIPAVAVTAYARHEDRERATSAGYHRYLGKPVDPTHLCATVAELLAGDGADQS